MESGEVGEKIREIRGDDGGSRGKRGLPTKLNCERKEKPQLIRGRRKKERPCSQRRGETRKTSRRRGAGGEEKE